MRDPLPKWVNLTCMIACAVCAVIAALQGKFMFMGAMVGLSLFHLYVYRIKAEREVQKAKPKVEPCPPHLWATNNQTNKLICQKCGQGAK